MKYYKTQDPKYDICVDDNNDDAYLVNSTTKRPILTNEPIMIFRAQDGQALTLISDYRNRCMSNAQKKAVGYRLKEFTDFAVDNPELVKEPDTDMSIFEN